MLCLSVQQPWAFLLVNNYKDVENRGWSTKHRGPLLIHAGRRIDEDGYEFARAMHRKGVDVWLPPKEELATGAVVGLVHVVDCTRRRSSPWHVEGQWGWYMKRGMAFDVPTTQRGELKLFEVAVDTLRLYSPAELAAVA